MQCGVIEKKKKYIVFKRFLFSFGGTEVWRSLSSRLLPKTSFVKFKMVTL